MISQELIKLFVPWLLFGLWLWGARDFVRCKAALITLYVTVFAGFSSNFAPLYREVGQAFSLFLGVHYLLGVLGRRAIPRWLAPVGVMLIFIVASQVSNGTSAVSLDSTLNFFAVSLVAALVVTRLLDSDARMQFALHLSRVAVVLAAISILEGVALGGRSEVTFSNSNYLGYFLGIASGVVLFSRSVGWKWLWFLVIVVGIYYTRSRAGLAFPVIAICVLLASQGAKRIVLVAPIFAAVSLFLLLWMPGMVGLGRDGQDASDTERLVAVEAGIEMLLEHPLFGIGWGRYIEEFWSALTRSPFLFEKTVGVGTFGHRDMVSHNDIVRVFAELGAPAGIFFLGLLVWSFRGVLRLEGAERGACITAFLGSMVFSLTHNNMNSAAFWVVLLLPLALSRSWRNQRVVGGA